MLSKKVIKFLSVLTFYTCLMILFVLFYMQDQMNDYIKKRTTLTTRFEMPDEMEFPTMTICMRKGMKKSVKDKYEFSENFDFWLNSYGPQNNTLSETFEDLSFILNRDFAVGISQFLTLKEVNLTLGINFVQNPFSNGSFDSYSVESLRTAYYGTCYKIQPINSGTWFKDYWVRIRVSLIIDIDNLKNQNDRPKTFDLYLTSNKTWHGIVRNNWKRFKPTRKLMKFGKQNVMSIRTEEIIYKEGIENSTSCYIDELIKTANCPFMCDLFHAQGLPDCNTFEELKCMYENWNWNHDCLRHKEVKRYKPDPTNRQGIASEFESIVDIFFQSKELEIVEEIDIISLSSLIGSIGGSLGMFFGFSFSGYFHIVFDKCFDKYFK